MDFDATMFTVESQFETHAVNWQQKASNECIGKVTDQQSVGNEIISDDTDEEEKEGEDLIGPNILENLAPH